MTQDTTDNNRRIVKNTLLLYMRSLFVMFVAIYTSRIVLASLGVDNFGIYNVVGGVVAMFSIISGSLSSSISRFLTFELGRNNSKKLRIIFSTSINIQLAISIIVVILGETVGLWFLNSQMNIPPDRLNAAKWVYHCSILVFVINLMNVPYTATIIAHERMSVFAYFSIFQVIFNLIIAYLVSVVTYDKLICYSLLLLFISFILHILYALYCRKFFFETHYMRTMELHTIREMSSFAGWTFVSDTSSVLNTQGINILINLFFGVAVNAARGVALQIESAIMRFVNDFTTSLNPQITKYYAQGEMAELYALICRGAKFAFFLLLLISLSFVIEAPYVLDLWLKNPPEFADVFFRLSMIATGLSLLGNTNYVACMATGHPRLYVLNVTPIGFCIFFVTLLAFKLGLSVTWAYWSVIITNTILMGVRLRVTNKLINFPIRMFLVKVIYRIMPVTILSFLFPLIAHYVLPYGFLRFLVVSLIAICSCVISVYLIGMTPGERAFVKKQILVRVKQLSLRN